MDCQIRLLIYKKKSIYDDVITSCMCICKREEFYNQNEFKNEFKNVSNDFTQRKDKFFIMSLRERGFNAYLLSVYIYIMNRSDIYRKSAVNVLKQIIKSKTAKMLTSTPVILLRLRTPKHQFLDYSWNKKITQMVMERQEIDHAMSWLSTLGGAFSALGDQFNHCAKVAGKISMEQFKLSMRLGDPQLVGRCRLYAALSLLQQGCLKASKRLIKNIFKFAMDEKDVRLQNMCQGVWAKLKYTYSQRKQRIKQLRKNS